MYELGDDLLMVASDRISTYDAVHPTEIPDKGRVLTGLSVLWFGLTRDIVPNHLISATDGVPDEYRGRALRVKRLEMLPVECIVRGYITGSGWKDYQRSGSVSGVGCPRACRSPSSCPSRSSRRRRRRRRGTTRRSTSREAGRARRLGRARRAAARRLDRRLLRGRRACARARRDPRRHEVRARPRRGRHADARRRGLHARLLALLARRPVRGRPRPAVVRQAVRARLGLGHRLGQVAARAARSPTTSSPRRASAT